MKTFLEWLLGESATFAIKGTESPKNLDYAVYSLANDVARKFPASFTNRSPFEEIALDGLATGQDHGVINFYSHEKPDAEKILKAIPYLAGEHGMKITGPIKQDISGSRDGQTVYRIPVSFENKTADPPPELNVAEANARELLAMLNLYNPSVGLYSDLDVRELAMKLSTATDFHTQMTARAPEEEGNFYSGGLSQEQLQRYLDTLESMVQWAIKNDYDTIEIR